jgi:hypothetical protein
MRKLSRHLKRTFFITCVCVITFSSNGCLFLDGFGDDILFSFTNHFGTFPPIPVSAWKSQKVEDAYWEEERYGKVPILDPVEGENAPLFCLDPPSPDEIIRALPDETAGGFAFLAETSRNNVRMVVSKIVDRIDEPRFFPMVGFARLHHCHYKCTVYYDKTLRSAWPVPFTHTDQTQEVVYIDHDHLIRVGGPAADCIAPGGP